MIQATIKNINQDGSPIIIFGAAIVGEALFQACINLGLEVECFCDNNINKSKKKLCGVKVIHTKELQKNYKDPIILISAADIKDVVDQLRGLGYSKWYAGSIFLKEFDVYKYKFSAPADFVEYAVTTCILCHDSYLFPDKLFLRSVDIIITERCSLKCRDCSNLMQYYKNPINCSTDEVLESINAFCAVVDEVNEFRVIGGEPFMNKDYDLVIKRLIDEPKVKKIVIYTNGTIIPREDKIGCLKNRKVLLIITDYGRLSKNLSKMIKVLTRHNIAYFAPKAHGWTDCAKIMKHNRDTEQQKEIFKNCCAKNTVTLSGGKLYRCPFAANVDRLQAVPNFKNDNIDLLGEPQDNIDIYKMKKEIRKYLLERDFLEVCDYCNGRSFGDPEIEPAVQIAKPIEYEKC